MICTSAIETYLWCQNKNKNNNIYFNITYYSYYYSTATVQLMN